MALTVCPECDGQVSDQAITCPHCGAPLKKGPTDGGEPVKKRVGRMVVGIILAIIGLIVFITTLPVKSKTELLGGMSIALMLFWIGVPLVASGYHGSRVGLLKGVGIVAGAFISVIVLSFLIGGSGKKMPPRNEVMEVVTSCMAVKGNTVPFCQKRAATFFNVETRDIANIMIGE